MHLQETLDCRISFTDEYAAKLKRAETTVHESFSNISFSWRPAATGTNIIGPVEIVYKGERLKSYAVKIDVLPEVGTNDYFEIRIANTDIRTNQAVEVIVQMQAQSGDREKYRDFIPRFETIADWVVDPGSSSYWSNGDLFGALEIYSLQPRRAGTILITRDMFKNLPESYQFTPKKILVRE
jgi:hypothetical protein